MYEGIKVQLETTKILQLVTEGKNIEHIEKAIEFIIALLTGLVVTCVNSRLIKKEPSVW
jgi:hypothetical protein